MSLHSGPLSSHEQRAFFQAVLLLNARPRAGSTNSGDHGGLTRLVQAFGLFCALFRMLHPPLPEKEQH
jgi:hypothetical protein